MKKSLILSVIVSALAFASGASAQLLSQNFNSFAGTAASLPSGFTVSGTATDQNFYYTASNTPTGANGIYASAFNDAAVDRAFTGRVAGGSTLTLSFSVTNTTGSALSGLSFSFNEEQYQDGAVGTVGNIALLSNNGSGVTFNQTNLTGSINNAPLVTSGGGTLNPSLSAARTATYTNTINAGSTVGFQFFYTASGSGARPVYGVDDLVVTAIPEPSTTALLGVSALGFAALTRRAS